MAAANPTVLLRDLHRQAGASWEIRQGLLVDEIPVDWTGCTAYCQVRTAADALIYTFTALTLTTGLLTMTAAPGGTILTPGVYRYDIDIVNGSARRLAFMAGNFRVGPQVTV